MNNAEALSELMLEVARHNLLRSHARLILDARIELDDILSSYHRMIMAAQGRGMVSEMDNTQEIAVLVCGTHDKLIDLEQKLNSSQIENVEFRKELALLREVAQAANSYLEKLQKPIPYSEYYKLLHAIANWEKAA